MGSPTAQSTGELTAGTFTIFNGHMFINAVIMQPSAVVTIFDNTAGSGKIVFQYTNASTSTQAVVFRNAVRCDIGATVVNSAGNCNVYFGAT